MGLYSAFRFFHEHGSQRAVHALDLARAELWAEDRVTFEWSQDELFSADDFDGADKVQECLVLRATDTESGEFEVLGGICDPDRNFARVCAAELASELMAHAVKRELARTLEVDRRF